MNRSFIASYSMKTAGYDQENEILEIEFYDGKIIQYIGVPFKLYQHFSMSGDLDRIFDTRIDGKFETREVKE